MKKRDAKEKDAMKKIVEKQEAEQVSVGEMAKKKLADMNQLDDFI